MAKYLLYRMTHDSGFAPNPWWGYLTLATCTPNHKRANLEPGDWIIGVEAKSLAEYRRKKFKKDGDYKEQRGDNVYYIEDKKWKWIRGHCHENEHLKSLPDEEVFINIEDIGELSKNKESREKYGDILKDLKGNRVYISKEFLYFGDKGIEFPECFLECLPSGQGIKYCPEELKNELQIYIDKLVEEYGYGVHGNPVKLIMKKKIVY